MANWLENNHPFISAQGQPTTVLDLCLQREIDPHRLLRGTCLFPDDMLCEETYITPQQYLRLLNNARQLLDSEDTAFEIGQRLLSGHQSAVNQLLSLTESLQQALQLLETNKALISPLLSPGFFHDENYGYLYWRDSCGLDKSHRFVVEATVVAIIAFSRRLYGEHLPWQIHFRHQQPRYIEQYWVHMGNNLVFNQPIDMMIIPRQFLTHCWQPLESMAYDIAIRKVQKLLHQLPAAETLLDIVYRHLMGVLLEPAGNKNVQLESVADHLQISSATLKRKLKKHGTHYQQQLDLARLHAALYLLSCKGVSSEEVAHRLHFHDSASFRRSFKRWTGNTPCKMLLSLNNTITAHIPGYHLSP